MSGDLLTRVRAAVATEGPAPPAPSHARAAAVLLLIDPTDAGLPILFVQRSQRVSRHRGQIGLPGGVVESRDVSLEETALREAHEELGVDPAQVEVIGRLTSFLTRVSDLWLTPFVGVQRAPVTPRADGVEVDEWFRVRLADLADAPHREAALLEDAPPVHFYDVEGRVIWGVTGAIVHDLLQRLHEPRP